MHLNIFIKMLYTYFSFRMNYVIITVFYSKYNAILIFFSKLQNIIFE